ncbi:MAG: peptidase [Verrucomicrobiaceae bacterium]|nr:peptidase [Verrucomicrobiaceae bacterium]
MLIRAFSFRKLFLFLPASAIYLCALSACQTPTDSHKATNLANSAENANRSQDTINSPRAINSSGPADSKSADSINTDSKNTASKDNSAHTQNAQRISELQIVDCLLPGQMRMLGNSSYLTPRRPVRTTAADCKIRGGEYIAYDRADYKTALNVWLEAAQSGDAEAQVNVGEIFERGLGGQPNYDAALIWYQKAAEQGNRRAQFNLGTFYEQGFGVEKDPVIALNWYRKAWGLPANEIGFKSYWEKTASAEREQLQQSVQNKDRQISVLEQQVSALRRKIPEVTTGSTPKSDPALTAQIDSLQELVKELSAQRQVTFAKAESIQLRQPLRTETQSTSDAVAQPLRAGNYQFGRFYALVIGDEQYQKIESLKTPLNDADEISALLQNRYGFKVTQLRNADNVTIMEAINNLNNVLTEGDNLLIYYAGHGSRTQSGTAETGFWLPVNADPPPRDTYWVSNDFVTRHIAHFKAKRVLVVADSCYAGLLSSEPGFLLLGANGVPSADYIRYKIDRRARLLLASGGDFPVLDNGGDTHSVFADAFISVLRDNTRLLTGPELYREVKSRVQKSASALQFQQEPVYKAIKEAGHEVGDFFFVPTAATAMR